MLNLTTLPADYLTESDTETEPEIAMSLSDIEV